MPKETFLNLENQKREIIIDAAVKEFSKYTFLEASVNRIVEQAGISKGSLYQYFEDKKDLYLYLIEIAGQRKLDYLREQEIIISFDDFYEGFEQLLFVGSKFSIANPLLSKIVRHATQGELVDESIQKMQDMNRVFLESLVIKAKENRQINDSIDSDLIVFLLNVVTTQFYKFLSEQFHQSVDGVGDHFMHNIDDESLKSHISNLTYCIKNGITPKKVGKS